MALGNIKGTVNSNIVKRMFYGTEVFHATMTVASNTVTGDGGSEGAPFLIDGGGCTLMGNKMDAAAAHRSDFWRRRHQHCSNPTPIQFFSCGFQVVAVRSRPKWVHVKRKHDD